MADLSGEKVRNTEYQASLETDQVRKLHEAKQRVLCGLQPEKSALPFIIFHAKTTIKEGLWFHFHLIQSQMNTHLSSIILQ